MIDAISPLRVGIGGPVGSGKTALMYALCKYFRDDYDIAAITNDIYTRHDAEFLAREGSLPPERLLGVEPDGCPNTTIREDASIHLAALAQLPRATDRTSKPLNSRHDNAPRMQDSPRDNNRQCCMTTVA